MILVAAAFFACVPGDTLAPDQLQIAAATSPAPADTLFADDFESGTLNTWQDGVDPTRQQVVTDPTFAESGSHYLDVTYPAGGDGGWLTRFFMPGYDSLYVSYYVRFPTNWLGSTKLIAFYGSRTDNQWSAMGQAGHCPTGTDFFDASLVTDLTGNAGPVRFYTYYPGMPRQPDGVTCYGSFGDTTTSYTPLAFALGAWHHVEFWVKLNTPGQRNGYQAFWVDGVQRGSWSGMTFRDSTVLELNSVMLTFSVGAAPQTQHLYVDNLVVSRALPTAAPAPAATVASVSVSPASTSVAVGKTVQLVATATDAAGNVLSGQSFTWVSGAPAVATVSASGLVTGISKGSATIAATSGAARGTSAVSVTMSKPGTVTDLSVAGTTDTSATLSFTEVNNGDGQPAGYDVRFAVSPISWGSAASVTTGTCAIPLAGTAIGAKRTCTVLGLKPATKYQFQMVAFRGALNVNAVFGALSNIASGTTPSAPTILGSVASVTLSPAPASVAVGKTVQLTASAKDVAGNVLSSQNFTWVSSALTVATVSGSGLVTGIGNGSATITAATSGVSGVSAVSVTMTAPGTVTDLAVAAVVDTAATLSFTEVTDGNGHPASYDVRSAVTPISWGSAASVTKGTCATPLAGTAIGAKRTCTVLGLTPGTAYPFQMVAFRGTLNVNAVFGTLSNTASGTTPSAPTLAGSVASVTLSPTSVSQLTGTTQRFAATLKDASGNVLTGQTVTWSSSNAVVATVDGTGLEGSLTAGAATVTAMSGGISGSAAVTVTAPTISAGAWANQPSGFTQFNDQPWDAMLSNGWSYLRRASSEDDDIVTDAAAPISPLNVLRIHFTPDMGSDNEPSVHWISIPSVKEIYTGWSIKLSSNWTASPAGAGKMTFLFTNGAGQVYTNLYHQGGDPVNGWIDGPPYRVGVNTEWAPYGQQVWLPNATTTYINPGEWHRIEVYYRWETNPGVSGDGIIRWWVDGVLNGNYTNVHYPASSFIEFQYAPTLQNAPPATQYMYVDHTYVSKP